MLKLEPYVEYLEDSHNIRGADLSAFLSLLRATYQIHQAAHWQSRGESYYGDHLLYQRLYEDVSKEIDSIAERVIGRSRRVTAVDPMLQAQMTAHMVRKLRGSSRSLSARKLARVSLQAEQSVLDAVDFLIEEGQSTGTENLLQGIADTHESHIYLLRQRLHES